MNYYLFISPMLRGRQQARAFLQQLVAQETKCRTS